MTAVQREHEATIFANASILTMNPERPRADSLAVRGGRIVAVGTRPEVTHGLRPPVQEIDLAGKTVIPGINDCHMHILPYGLQMEQLDVGPTQCLNMAELCRRVTERAATPGFGSWVRGRGYNHDLLLERHHPTRDDLDRATDMVPVALTHTSGHVLTCNTRALELAGIDGATENPPGGEIERDIHGRPTGVLKETAMRLLASSLPAPTASEARDAILAAMRQLATEGITSASDASTGHDQSADREIAAYVAAMRSGNLVGRIVLMPQIMEVATPQSDQPALTSADFSTGGNPEWLRVCGVKIFSDGAITTRTAALGQPYLDSNVRGLSTWDQETLTGMVSRAHAAGWQIATHAMGDEAIRMTLDAYEAAQVLTPRGDARHRIEHCSLPGSRGCDRMKTLGVLPVVQPELIARFGDSYVAGLGRLRAVEAMPIGWFADRGLQIAFSSDRPVVSGNPFLGMAAAMQRITPTGEILGADHQSTVEEALRRYTAGSAYATFAEADKGRLAPGFLADFAVVDRDLTTTPADEIDRIKVLMTVVDGVIVHDARC